MNEHSPKFQMIKTYYEDGRWKINRVRMAVKAQWITADEFQEITGQEYEAGGAT